MKQQREVPKPREITLPHHSYQPSKAEIEEEFRANATFEEVVDACLAPVKITYEKPKRQGRK